MLQCPHCQTPHEKGQRYCSVCGTYLHPEKGDKFCPQCGTRVTPQQELCHECDAPLQGKAAAAQAGEATTGAGPAAGTAPSAPAKGMQSWIIGLVIGVGIIIAILVILLFTRGIPPPAVAPKAEAPASTGTTPAPPPADAPEAMGPAAPTPASALKDQLQSVLSAMREAHLKKDIVQYMNCYSLTFPDREEKRQDTSKSWDEYDYLKLVFTLDEVQPLDSNNATARATWYIDTRNRRTQELSSLKQVYRIRFAKELANWRIRSLEEIG